MISSGKTIWQTLPTESGLGQVFLQHCCYENLVGRKEGLGYYTHIYLATKRIAGVTGCTAHSCA